MMDKKFEYRGIWWLPGKPEKRVEGTLRYAPGESIILELDGTFKNITEVLESCNPEVNFNPEIILGFSRDRKKITLYECLEKDCSAVISFNGESGSSNSSFIVRCAFIGDHFNSADDLKFKKVEASYSYLEEWVGISGFDVNTKVHADGLEYTVRCLTLELAQAKIEDFKISLGYNFTSHQSRLKEISFKQTPVITVELEHELRFEEIHLNILRNIENFLSLATMETAYPLTIKAFRERTTSGEEERTAGPTPAAEVVYSQKDRPAALKRLVVFDMLFSFQDVREQFEAYLRNWFSRREHLEPVFNLFFGVRRSASMYLEYCFLGLIQAIEVYHRRVMRNHEIPQEDHEKRVSVILSTVPDEHREWLKGKLENSNEPSLRRRLKDVLENFAPVLKKYIGEKKSFINKVILTRNYLTHYDESKKDEAIKDPQELFALTQKLTAVLEVCLLAGIGFSFEKINELISRNERYNYAFRV